MSGSCCTKQCFLITFSYIAACSNIIGGIKSFWGVGTYGIVVGAISLVLGVLLLIGLIQNKKTLVLIFIICEAVILWLTMVLIIIGFAILDKTYVEYALVREILIAYFIVILFVAVLWGVVCRQYKEMNDNTNPSRSNRGQKS